MVALADAVDLQAMVVMSAMPATAFTPVSVTPHHVFTTDHFRPRSFMPRPTRQCITTIHIITAGLITRMPIIKEDVEGSQEEKK